MPQMGFYVGGAGVSVGGLQAGVARFFLAWDPFDGGPEGAMFTVYDWMSAAAILGGGRIRNYEPIKIAPIPKELGATLGRRLVKFQLSPGQAAGAGMTDYPDLLFQVFDENSRVIYEAGPTPDKPLKPQVKGVWLGGMVGFQSRLYALDMRQTIFNASPRTIGESLLTEDGGWPPSW
jgi:hypothetical protein